MQHQQRNIYRYTGHQNTSKNLIRSHFASNDQLVVSGSEDGLVYIWPREISVTSSSSESESDATKVKGGNAAIPAYYPPRDLRQTKTETQSGGASGINVRPLRTLEGHGDGAVFDVKWTEEGVVSAGEDGKVGVWAFEDDEGEGESITAS